MAKQPVRFAIIFCFISFFIIGSISFVFSPAWAGEPDRVLFISAYHPGFPTFFQQVEGAESVFNGKEIVLDIEFMDTKRFPGKENLDHFLGSLSCKLGLVKPYDLVMVADDNALLFALDQQFQLLKGIPVVFLGVNDMDLALGQNSNPQVTGVIEAVSQEETIELMINLNPKASQIVALVDGTPSGQGDLRAFYRLKNQFPKHRFSDISLTGLTWQEFSNSIGRLGEESAVLLLSAYKDKNNQILSFDESLKRIITSLSVPLFHLWYHGLGDGVLGGKVISHHEQAKAAAEIALEILRGRPVHEIKVTRESPNRYVFDYNQLKAYHLSASMVPADSLILNVPYSFYGEHKALIWCIAGAFSFISMALLLSIINILGRRKVEAQLRNSEARRRKIFDEALDGLCLAEAETGIIIDCNRALAELVGRDKAELIGQHQKILHPDESNDAPVSATFERHRTDHEGRTLITRVITGKGVIKDVEIKGTGFEMDGLRIMAGIFKDITESKRRDAERGRLEAAIHQAAEVVIITDSKGDIQYVNPAFENLTGYSRGEVISRNPRILKSNHHDDFFYRGMWETISHGKTWQGRLVNRKKDGSEFIEEATISPVKDGEGRIVNYVAVKRDVTKETMLEKRLLQAQKIEAIGTLAGGIAHDFNNMLYPLIGYAELLKDDLPLESPSQHHIDNILHAALRARDLVKQILVFSRQGEQAVKPMKLQPVVKEALDLLRSSIPATIEIQHEIDPGCGVVIADPTHIHQIVMNLATNAYQAMEETGGRLRVTLGRCRLEAGPLILSGLSPGDYAILTVADTGAGIEKDIQDKLFDPYFTTKEQGKGTGLGLSVVQGIVKSCNGDIGVYSEPGRGTEVRVYLPMVMESKVEKPDDQVQAIEGGTEKILLIDDEEHIVHMEQQMLTRLGYRITAKTASIEALEAFKACPDAFDLIVTDMTMPGMTGFELTMEIKRIRPDIPVILCTGFSDPMIEEKSRALGIGMVLLKPLVRREIAQAIRGVLDKFAETAL
ncbi:MAG: PAS domain S-box protein [Desulfobacteraceae bacterium]|nr:PAS domain S-box protein [Desulfobacteraceae bacterium]